MNNGFPEVKMAEIDARDIARSVPHLQLSHFTPMNRDCWCWMFMRPLMTLTGPQKTITGHVVDCNPGITAWTGFRDLPSFETREDAERYAERWGLTIHSVSA